MRRTTHIPFLAVLCGAALACTRADLVRPVVTATPAARVAPAHRVGASLPYAFPVGPVNGVAHGVIVSEGPAGIASSTGAATNGQVLTGVTGSDPVWQTNAATVTWATDLVTSTNSSQIVSQISGAAPVNVTNGAISIGANASATGGLRLPNSLKVSGRNATNSGDVSLLFLDGSNEVQIGDASNAAALIGNAAAAGTAYFAFGGALKESFSATGVRLYPYSAGYSHFDSSGNITSVQGASDQLLGENHAGTDVAFFTLGGDGAISSGNLVLSTVNSNVGSVGSSSLIPVLTLNAKGLVTAATTAAVAAPLGSATGTLAISQLANGLAAQMLVTNSGATSPVWVTASGDVTLAATGAHTLATVNANVGTFGSTTAIPQFTVDGKGRITAASTVSLGAGGLPAITLTGDTTGSGSGGSIATTTSKLSGAAPINVANSAVSFGATPANTGAVRLGSTQRVTSRNAGNTGDVPLIYLDGSDEVQLGDTTHTGAVIFNGNSGATWYFYDNSFEFEVSGGSLLFPNTTLSPTISQSAMTTAGGTAHSTSLSAQDETGTGTTVGGDYIISSGSGVSNGAIRLQNGHTDRLVLSTSGFLKLSAYTSGFARFDASGNVSTTTVNLASSTDVGTSIAGAANGGTGRATLTADNLIAGNGTGTVLLVPPVAAGDYLKDNGPGVLPSYSAINAATDLSGIAPVPNGGTGRSGLTAHGVLLGEGTAQIGATSAGTTGQPLLSGGASADPAYGTLPVAFGGACTWHSFTVCSSGCTHTTGFSYTVQGSLLSAEGCGGGGGGAGSADATNQGYNGGGGGGGSQARRLAVAIAAGTAIVINAGTGGAGTAHNVGGPAGVGGFSDITIAGTPTIVWLGASGGTGSDTVFSAADPYSQDFVPIGGFPVTQSNGNVGGAFAEVASFPSAPGSGGEGGKPNTIFGLAGAPALSGIDGDVSLTGWAGGQAGTIGVTSTASGGGGGGGGGAGGHGAGANGGNGGNGSPGTGSPGAAGSSAAAGTCAGGGGAGGPGGGPTAGGAGNAGGNGGSGWVQVEDCF